MGKWWSVLFAVVMLACGGLFIVAPFVGWWLPEGVSSHSDDVDFLFYVILGITGFFFFLTEALLCYFMAAYAGHPGKLVETNRPQLPVFLKVMSQVTRLVPRFLHHEHRVEMAWTLVPAVILLYIAFAQVNTWAKVKYQSRAPLFEGNEVPVQVAVTGRQFEWRMRYPSSRRFETWLEKRDKETKADFDSFARHPQADDVQLVNELHVFVGQPTLTHVATRDVIHSFNLPQFRVKQDALPGRVIPVWFTPTKANTRFDEDRQAYVNGINPATGQHDGAFVWDLPCAELCGWGHYRMIGYVYVHKDRAEFLDWLRRAERYAHQREGDVQVGKK